MIVWSVHIGNGHSSLTLFDMGFLFNRPLRGGGGGGTRAPIITLLLLL